MAEKDGHSWVKVSVSVIATEAIFTINVWGDLYPVYKTLTFGTLSVMVPVKVSFHFSICLLSLDDYIL